MALRRIGLKLLKFILDKILIYGIFQLYREVECLLGARLLPLGDGVGYEVVEHLENLDQKVEIKDPHVERDCVLAKQILDFLWILRILLYQFFLIFAGLRL